ncbi:ABC transporter ATP-binding protein [Halovivax cerinus]|uniref:ABC transporter ATP-binding protein n=1 Tax=Halovivax cerinus TaxID=1487865 RepID=A0ABD5NRZ2_9EURY|nr:ABC transporter ATP-binding protein [Halovivax cerinus]
MNSMLHVDGLHAGYGKALVLNGVDIEVEEGAIVCLIGPNGAGKSTVFRCIYNLLSPSRGSITFKGEEITGLSQRELLDRGLGYMLQRDAVFPEMTVRENLELGGYTAPDGVDTDDRLAEVYDLFPKLSTRESQQAGTLSGGERQMVEFARGLMQDPDMLLLDEPSAGLSPKNIDTVFEKVLEINELGVTILMIEQNVNTALDYADRGYVLENGQTRFDGPAETLLDQPEIRDAYLGG